MNIKITKNWLDEYLETNATVEEIQTHLSLCGPSVEQVVKLKDDYVLDIEITSNRIDTASVIGIAQEAFAILPQFGKQAVLKNNPLTAGLDKLILTDNKPQLLEVQITDPKLCTRFTAILLDNVVIGPSPALIKNRLEMCGIRSINNVVDISNYIMLTLGQPTHIFDYDKIGDAKMIMRVSKPGEQITTLDDKTIKLPGNDIIIEDGNGDLIDLCGIMGGKNSAVTNATQKILLFVQTYNKTLIRKTVMTTGKRTDAATYFEKGLDEERVMPALYMGIKLLEKYTKAKVASKITDIYPLPFKVNKVDTTIGKTNRLIGVSIPKRQILEILTRLHFEVNVADDDHLQVLIPSFRKNDIFIEEDIVEEIARIYGYHNLPNHIPPIVYIKQPVEIEKTFEYQKKIKLYLKHHGLTEVMNYSMIGKTIIEQMGLDMTDHLTIINSISDDIKYLRKTLVPSMIKNLIENIGKEQNLKLFEIAKVYLKKTGELPDEPLRLCIGTTLSYTNLKGLIESLFLELNVTDILFKPSQSTEYLLPALQADIYFKQNKIGMLGTLKPGIYPKKTISIAEFDLKPIIENAKILTDFQSINPYAVIKLDANIQLSDKLNFTEIKRIAFKQSPNLKSMDVIDILNNKLTVRFYFTRKDYNMTEKEAMVELDKITQQFY